jgi:hypothetical protein
MPQFDLSLYYSIFLIFSTLLFLFYLLLSLIILPYFWNIFYIRYYKKQYNLFLMLLYRIQLIHLNNLNLDLVFDFTNLINRKYINKLYVLKILNNIYLNIIKYKKKND